MEEEGSTKPINGYTLMNPNHNNPAPSPDKPRRSCPCKGFTFHLAFAVFFVVLVACMVRLTIMLFVHKQQQPQQHKQPPRSNITPSDELPKFDIQWMIVSNFHADASTLKLTGTWEIGINAFNPSRLMSATYNRSRGDGIDIAVYYSDFYLAQDAFGVVALVPRQKVIGRALIATTDPSMPEKKNPKGIPIKRNDPPNPLAIKGLADDWKKGLVNFRIDLTTKWQYRNAHASGNEPFRKTTIRCSDLMISWSDSKDDGQLQQPKKCTYV